MKKTLKYLGFYLIFLILITFLCSLLNLIGLNSSITNILLFLFNVIAIMVLGFKKGITSNKKGYLSGLEMGLITLVILFIVNLVISQVKFNMSLVIYYLILLLCAIFGGMLGKAKKKGEN